MEILKVTEACLVVDDDLLDFTLEDDAEEGVSAASSSSLTTAAAFSLETGSGSFSEFVEEELEWLSNKDAFPSVDTCFSILSDNPELMLNDHGPISVLENSSNSSSNGNSSSIANFSGVLKVPRSFPVRPRSKRRRRKRTVSFGKLPNQQLWLPPISTMTSSGATMGRRCLHCHAGNTPQWRAGPMGPKTLCNACGVRYKSGRLLPEYRPANSPTFSSVLHSNSHRKVVEMRRQKYAATATGDGIIG